MSKTESKEPKKVTLIFTEEEVRPTLDLINKILDARLSLSHRTNIAKEEVVQITLPASVLKESELFLNDLKTISSVFRKSEKSD